MEDKRSILEAVFEGTLWKSRLIVLLAVVFGLFGGIAVFIVASYDIWYIMVEVYNFMFHHYHPEHFHSEIIGGIIGAVDLYLIAVVMLIFSFGLLIVSFFKKVINMSFATPLEMLYLAGSILALALALYFMHKGEH